MAHSTAIANEFIARAHRDNKPLTQMQVQKLVYISHGWNLAINGEPLTDDGIYAWDYGPVYPDLWDSLKVYGKRPVERKIKVRDYGFGILQPDAEEEVTARGLSEQSRAVIDKVYESYSDFKAFQLSALTHQSDTPWHKVFVQDGQKKGLISDQSIRQHFLALARNNPTHHPAAA